MKNTFVLSLGSILIVFSMLCCTEGKKETTAELRNSTTLQFSIFLTRHGYGYNIIDDGKVNIHQPLMPISEVKSGFASAEDATKIAQLVITKINDKLSPAISLEDLQNSGIVIYDYKSREGLYTAGKHN